MNTLSQLTDKQRYWYEHIQRARDTAESLAAYAKEQNLDVKLLYHYQSVLRQKGLASRESKFTRLAHSGVVEPPPVLNDHLCIQLRNGHRIIVPVNSVDLNTLLQSVNRL